MNGPKRVGLGAVLATLLAVTPRVGAGQGGAVVPPLADAVGQDGWTLFNRSATARAVGSASGIYLDARPGLGIAWYDGTELAEGSLEVTLQGRNVPQASFVGLAFRGIDDETFEAVYFRPFNFQASDPVARGHAVQYVAHPQYTWQRLRATSPGDYEAAISPSLDPDVPFTARIELAGGRVRVFVNDAPDPCLDVAALGAGRAGKVGLWVGNNSDGLFSTLRIIAHPLRTVPLPPI